MFNEPMFFERPSFEKVAVTVKMPDNETKWAPKILSELHRQVPVMEEFHANIILDRLEPNKGFGFGYILAQPKVLNPMMSEALPKIKIPVIIREWELAPLDVFFDQEGHGFPLTERRIREALLKPSNVDVPTKEQEERDGPDIRSMLQPPWENVGQFYRGVNTQVGSGQVKTSSLLMRINGTVEHGDTKKLAEWVTSEEGRASLHGDQTIRDVFLGALRLRGVDSLVKESSATGPVITQYRWDGGPFIEVKQATPDSFTPRITKLAAVQAAQQMPEQAQQQVAQQGQATEAPQAAVMTPAEMEVDEFTPIASFGVYKVITTSNEQMVGWVFPYVLSYDLEKVPTQVFSDGTSFHVGNIAGVPAGVSTSLPSEQPQGRGMFYMRRNGRVFGLAPVEIMGQQQGQDGGIIYMARTMLGGNDLQLQPVQGIRVPSVMGEGLYAIPADVGWLPFKQPINPLVDDPAMATQRAGAYYMMQVQQAQAQAQQQQEQAQQQQQRGGKRAQGGQQKQASWQNLQAKVRMTQDGTYSLGGRAFESLHPEYTQFLDYADTEWMLALAGVDPEYTQEKLANLRVIGGYTEFPVFRAVTPPTKSVEKVAARHDYARQYKMFMPKHAAALKDTMVADSLLSLNFLSSKNLNMFMSYLPQLNESVNAVVNLLLASRVGLNEIPEGACVEAMMALEKVITGVKMLMLREASL
jgi:hypothetical protein